MLLNEMNYQGFDTRETLVYAGYIASVFAKYFFVSYSK